jgi:predicted phosphodiesterase
VVCGGSHVPFDRTVAGARVINVGSVGEAPRGTGPYPHADATLIVIRGPESRVDIEQIAVPLGRAA